LNMAMKKKGMVAAKMLKKAPAAPIKKKKK
jgi:hypothetical protein